MHAFDYSVLADTIQLSSSETTSLTSSELSGIYAILVLSIIIYGLLSLFILFNF